MASNFPQEIDNILEFKDLTSQDLNAVKTYQNAMQNGDMQSANNALREIIDYQQKIISAERLNKIRDAILAVEQFYGVDIRPYIEEKQKEWETIINEFKYEGVYNPDKLYQLNNIVYYEIGELKQLYICIKNTEVGIDPTNQEYWRVLTVKGQIGATNSENTSFYFIWSSLINYNANSIVVHNNNWWISKQPNINEEPMENSQYWDLVLKTYQAIYPVQKEEPVLNIGELWFEVI